MINASEIAKWSFTDIPNQQNVIDGQSVSAADGATMDVISPINGQNLTTIPDSGAIDVDRAVQSSRKALETQGWSGISPKERKAILMAIADAIERHAAELTVLGVRDNGTELAMAYKAEAGSAAATFRFYAEAIDKRCGEVAPTSSNILALVEREPIGVVGVIVPWNFPLMIAAWKIAPALAAGCCVVVKPAETASLALLRVAQLALDAGLPPGVFNVVTGSGESAGSAIALHDDVDALAFTGSGGVGRKLLEYSAKSNMKPVYLELGGKSPNIIFDDYAKREHACRVAASSMFRNSGQVCISGSRLLVQRTIYEEALSICVDVAKSIRMGNPLDPATEMGAINSAQQLDKNLTFVQNAMKEGADLCCGGERVRESSGGFYMAPTIFGNVDNRMQIAQQEVFGPLLSVIPFDDEADALRIANDSRFGLAAGLWTDSLSRAHRVVRALKSGLVHVNCYGGSDLTVPLGGMRQSGNGYDKSLHALDKFCKLKTSWIQL